MTAQINVHDAKTHFSRLLQRVMTGEEIVIARAGKPVARLLPFASQRRTDVRPTHATLWATTTCGAQFAVAV